MPIAFQGGKRRAQGLTALRSESEDEGGGKKEGSRIHSRGGTGFMDPGLTCSVCRNWGTTK